jgi:inner membrane protein
MDNLTHSLVGALLGQMGLKRKTGLAMPTLIFAANIPDIDAVAVLLGGHQHLAIRRGITHGPIAMVLLPLLLWAAMLWFDAWQTRRGKRPEARLPVHKGWLLALSFIGCLSHPLFDWFNSYGIRLLEPFSSQWFYGDTLFIIDVWIWAALIAGVGLSLRREREGHGEWQRPALIGCGVICAYILANGMITAHAEALTSRLVTSQRSNSNEITTARRPDPMVVANPMPVSFWKREMLWRDGPFYGSGNYSISGGVALSFGHEHVNLIVANRIKTFGNDDLRAFLFWSRMPIIDERDGHKWIGDQRFANPLVGDRFRVKVKEIQ